MSGLDPKTLRRLAPALEAVKDRDAAAFRAQRAAADAIRSEIHAHESAIAEAAAGIDPSDLISHAAYLRFRAAGLARIDALKLRLAEQEAQEAVAREALARSHGAAEGCARLADQAEAEARRRLAARARL